MGGSRVARDFAKRFYRSKAWLAARNAYMRKPVETQDGRICPPFMCERCFEVHGRLFPAKLVHHKVHLTPYNISDPGISLSESNLMRVCQDCHAELHSDSEYTPRVAFDENGRVIPLGETDPV